MGQPAAKQGDKITGTDLHVLVPPPPATPVATAMPFNGMLTSGLSTNVLIQGRPAATVGSVAINTPPHLPPPVATFQKPPSNQGRVQKGSATVLINGKGAARSGDPAMTCNDPVDLPNGTVVATSTVLIGG